MHMMKAGKMILATCMLLSAILFAEGIRIIFDVNNNITSSEPNHENSYMKLGEVSNEPIAVQTLKPVNLLVMGLDEEQVRSDVLIVLNFDPNGGRLNVLSIARDTRVRVKNRTSKINALIKIGGEKLVMEKVEELTGLDIQYYITLNFEGFRRIVDALDGVEIAVPFNMNYEDPDQDLHIHLKKGVQVLDGKKAEQFVRYRKGNKRGIGYEDGDVGRIKMQHEFIKALIKQKLKLKYISKIDDIYLILKKCLKTNIDIKDINRYLKTIQKLKIEEIQTYTLPGEPAYIGDLWYYIQNKKETRKLIEENFYK